MAYLLEKVDLDVARDMIVAQLEKKNFFKLVVEKLNDAVDVPFVGEKKEKAAIKGIVREFISALKNVDFADFADDGEDSEDEEPQVEV